MGRIRLAPIPIALPAALPRPRSQHRAYPWIAYGRGSTGARHQPFGLLASIGSPLAKAGFVDP